MGTPTLHFVYMELAATSVCIDTRVFVPCIAQLFIRAARWKRKPAKRWSYRLWDARLYENV